MLVAAFRATLEEVIEADLILHVRDIAHAETEAQAADVETVLAEPRHRHGAGRQPHPGGVEQDRPAVAVHARRGVGIRRAGEERHPALVSAVTGEGIDALLEAIDARLGRADEVLTLTVPAREGRLIHWLHENADVMEAADVRRQRCDVFRIRVASEKKQRLLAQLKAAGVAADA